jgi:hypothetical protein
VRTTLTLDDDVAAKLKTATRKSGRSFRDVVNDALRRGLVKDREAVRAPFTVQPRDLGLKPGLEFDNIGKLLDYLDDPTRQ